MAGLISFLTSTLTDIHTTNVSPQNPLPVGDGLMATVIPSQSLTRPANVVTYASGQLVANNTVAGSVTPFAFLNATKAAGSTSRMERVRMRKTGTGLTNAYFRAHFYGRAPVPVNGDGAAWLTSIADYLGAFDLTVDRAFTDGAEGAGVPKDGNALEFTLNGGTTLYGLLEARGAYPPVSLESFMLFAELYRF